MCAVCLCVCVWEGVGGGGIQVEGRRKEEREIGYQSKNNATYEYYLDSYQWYLMPFLKGTLS